MRATLADGASLSALFSALLLGSVHSARAQDRPLAETIELVGSSACFVEPELEAQIATWLGRSTADRGVQLTLRVEASGATLTVEREGRAVASRTFTSLPPACADRLALLGLAAALALDATVVRELQPEAAPRSVDPQRTREGLVRGYVGLEVFVLGLVLPDAVGAVSLTAGLSLAPVRVGAGVLVTTESGARLTGGVARASLVAGRLDACLDHVEGGARLGGCVGVWAGALSAEGRGFAVSRSATAPWLAATTRFDASYFVLRGLALRATVGALVPFVVPRLDVLGADGTLLESQPLPPLGFMLSVGAELEIE